MSTITCEPAILLQGLTCQIYVDLRDEMRLTRVSLRVSREDRKRRLTP